MTVIYRRLTEQVGRLLACLRNGPLMTQPLSRKSSKQQYRFTAKGRGYLVFAEPKPETIEK